MIPDASFSAPASLRSLYRQTRRAAVRTVKSMLLASGAYGRLRSWRCQSSLLVAMFHRVLPAGHLHWQSEIPDCTITDRVFASSLDLMCRFHEPVAARDVVAALSGGPSLPRHAVLITFDDGWIDTLTVAGPILAQRRIPSVVFIPPVIFDSPGPFWQERLTYNVATGRLGVGQLDALVAAVAVEPPPPSADARQALARAIPVLTGAPSSTRGLGESDRHRARPARAASNRRGMNRPACSERNVTATACG